MNKSQTIALIEALLDPNEVPSNILIEISEYLGDGNTATLEDGNWKIEKGKWELRKRLRFSDWDSTSGSLFNLCTYFRAYLKLSDHQLISRLKVHPETGAVAKITGESQRWFSTNPSFAIEDLSYTAWRYA